MHQSIKILSGNIDKTLTARPRGIFDASVIGFLDEISRRVLKDTEMRSYADLISIAFFLRKSSVEKLRKDYCGLSNMGVGVVFHITPSNIPVQFFYSLAVSLLAGNANIVRVSKKEYEQSRILYRLMEGALEKYPEMRDYICLVRYGYEKEVTDYLSARCDARIIWGGNASIEQIRRSPLPPRAFDVTFADRFSLCVIDAEKYLIQDEKMLEKIAEAFYVDTYFSDQNACNSSRMVVWVGNEDVCRHASGLFWERLYGAVKGNYQLNGISAVDKLIKACAFAIEKNGSYDYPCSYGNFINVIQLSELSDGLSKYKGNSGLFLQSYLDSLDRLGDYIQKDWQTITYLGIDPSEIYDLLVSNGVRGIDRIVPIGSSGTPSLKWDGIDFIERLSRNVDIL